jgi:hypothetical protein
MIARAAVVFLSLPVVLLAQQPVQQPAQQPTPQPAGPAAAKPDAPAAQAPAQAALPTYARAGTRGARLRSLADDKGHLLCDIPAGTLLKLSGDRAGWVQAEVPGGFAAWVSGRYVRETETPGTLELDGDRVNLRPLPQIDNVNNFPVGTLQRGTRVQLVERARPDLSLKDDWVRIWTPAGSVGWLRKAEAEALAAGVDGASAWSDAVAKGTHIAAPIYARPALTGTAAPVAGATGATTGSSAGGAAEADAPAPPTASLVGAELELANARALLATARTAEQPDIAGLRAAYEKVIALDTRGGVEGSFAVAARGDLVSVTVLETAAAMRAEIEASKTRVTQQLAERRQQVVRDAAAKDPLTQSYPGHGTIVRRTTAAGIPQFWLVQGSRDVCQLLCSSGRYKLELYAGRYVGVHGVKGTLPSGDASIDAQRIEVLRP